MTILALLLWGLLILVATATVVVIVLSAIPLDLVFHIDTPRGESDLRVTWLFGAVRLFPRPSAGGTTHGEKHATRRRKDRRRKRARRRAPRNPAVFLRGPCREAATALVVRVIRRIRFRHVHIAARVGLNDPADTGLLYGLVQPVLAEVRRRSSSRVGVEADFSGPGVEIVGDGAVRVVPIVLVGSIFTFVPTRRGRRLLRCGKEALWKRDTR